MREWKICRWLDLIMDQSFYWWTIGIDQVGSPFYIWSKMVKIFDIFSNNLGKNLLRAHLLFNSKKIDLLKKDDKIWRKFAIIEKFMIVTWWKVHLLYQYHSMNTLLMFLVGTRFARLKSQLEKNYIEHQIHWAKRARQYCFQFGDRNNKFFQTMTIIRKSPI